MTMGFLQLARPRIAGVMPFRRSDLRNGSRLAVMRVLPRYAGVFATTPSGLGRARRGALDLTTQGLQFGHQVHQRPGGKDAVRLLGRRVMQHHRYGASS